MVEYLGYDHQFIGAGALDERLQSFFDGVGRSDGRAGQNTVEQPASGFVELLEVILPRRRQLNGLAGARRDERLLYRCGQKPCLLVGVGGNDIETQQDRKSTRLNSSH